MQKPLLQTKSSKKKNSHSPEGKTWQDFNINKNLLEGISVRLKYCFKSWTVKSGEISEADLGGAFSKE